MPDCSERYNAARRLGRRYIAEARNGGLLPVLEERLGDKRRAGEYSLGLVEVPLKKIIGTYFSGRKAAFAGNFMPILAPDSELAVKWVSLCQAHQEEGIRDPIKAYEYLGYYYVVEGHKRVSVLRAHDAYSITAEVTRILPAWENEDADVSVLYEYYRHNRRMPVLHMWFSAPGRLTWLFQEAARLASDREQADTLLRDAFVRFRQNYHAQGYGRLPITTGDAFYDYAGVFGLTVDTPRAELVDNMRACLRQWQFEQQSAPEPELRSALPRIHPKNRVFKAAFAFPGIPGSDSVTRLHDVGRRQLARTFPEIEIECLYDLPEGEAAWAPLQELLRREPDALFVTAASHETLAWRAGLVSPGCAVLCATPHHPPRRRLSTCWGRTREPAYICGALAGLVTKTDRIATVSLSGGDDGGDTAAFAAGVSLTNDRARVLYGRAADSWGGVKAVFAAGRADTAWITGLENRRLTYKKFPGMYAGLYALGPNARLAETLAAAAWHWGAFYRGYIAGLLEDGNPADVRHPRLGLSEGLLRVHLSNVLLGRQTPSLMEVLEDAVVSGRLPAGALYDAAGVLRAPAGGTLFSLEDIDWLPDNVTALEI